MAHQPCDCIRIVEAQLKERNTRIKLPLFFSGAPEVADRVQIVTEQIEKGRGKPREVGLIATFCPFCGTRYTPEPAARAADTEGGAE